MKSIVARERERRTEAGGKKRSLRRGHQDLVEYADPRTILVPTDFSAGAERALVCAKALGRKFSARIVLVHVIDPLHTPGRFDAPRLRALRKEAVEVSKSKIRKIAEDHADSSGCLEHHVTDGTSHTAIVKFAKKVKVDWIVMGSKGQTGMKRLLAGSVAENVVRNAKCPVLVVP